MCVCVKANKHKTKQLFYSLKAILLFLFSSSIHSLTLKMLTYVLRIRVLVCRMLIEVELDVRYLEKLYTLFFFRIYFNY